MIDNADRLPIVDRNLQAVIKKHSENIEFLPITILNHRNKVASEDYSILVVLTIFDCIDKKQSVVFPSPILPSKYSDWDKIVLDESKILEGCNLFKLKMIPNANIISQPLKEAIEADPEIKGVKFIPIEKFTAYSY